MASASVGSLIKSCHFSSGSWLVKIVDFLLCRSSIISSKSFLPVPPQQGQETRGKRINVILVESKERGCTRRIYKYRFLPMTTGMISNKFLLLASPRFALKAAL